MFLLESSRNPSCSNFESGCESEQMPDENPFTSRMGNGDLNNKKSKLEDTGSPSNTSTPKKQKNWTIIKKKTNNILPNGLQINLSLKKVQVLL